MNIPIANIRVVVQSYGVDLLLTLKEAEMLIHIMENALSVPPERDSNPEWRPYNNALLIAARQALQDWEGMDCPPGP